MAFDMGVNLREEVFMDYIIRKLKKEEVKVLDTFLYEAIFIPEGAAAPSRDIIT